MNLLNANRLYDADEQQQKQVVVLKASVGGAIMLRRFFEKLPNDLSMAFILIMPMADEFLLHFAQRLSDVSGLDVKRPEAGDRLEVNQCWLLSETDNVSLSPHGDLDLILPGSDLSSWFSVISEVASVFNRNSGVVFLSGKSVDISAGCRDFASHGGFVFAQSAETCVVPGLTDSARETGCVEFCGSPEELMYEVQQRYHFASRLLC